MASGVGELVKYELDRLTTGRRIGMQFNIDDDAFEMNAVTRAADLEDQLHLLAAKLAFPRWDRAPVDRMKAGVLAAYDSLSSSPEGVRSEEHTSELQSLMRISYAVFCLKQKTETHI